MINREQDLLVGTIIGILVTLYVVLLFGCSPPAPPVVHQPFSALNPFPPSPHTEVPGADASVPSDSPDACVGTPTKYYRLTQRCNDIDYWDDLLRIRCSWATAADGITRCLPENSQSAAMYGNDNCTVPIAMMVWSEHYIGIRGTVYFAGPAYHGDLVWYVDSNGCMPTSPIAFGDIGLFYIGGEVPSTTFVQQ